jgi:hypothetical protein
LKALLLKALLLKALLLKALLLKDLLLKALLLKALLLKALLLHFQRMALVDFLYETLLMSYDPWRPLARKPLASLLAPC